MSSSKNYYAILDIPKAATAEDIKNAYKKLARKWHPDKNPDKLEEADRRFKEISEAYQVLSNSQTKYTYDSSENRDSSEYDYNFDSTQFYFRTAEDIYKEFFGEKTAQEALEEFINDPAFAALGCPSVPSSRNTQSSHSRTSDQHPTPSETQTSGWGSWLSKLTGWYNRSEGTSTDVVKT